MHRARNDGAILLSASWLRRCGGHQWIFEGVVDGAIVTEGDFEGVVGGAGDRDGVTEGVVKVWPNEPETLKASMKASKSDNHIKIQPHEIPPPQKYGEQTNAAAPGTEPETEVRDKQEHQCLKAPISVGMSRESRVPITSNLCNGNFSI
mmetsp:Transcript_25564/g.59384  ORF Transcript_25564/g.59384 Transcript_25564/m.59384 type:complete len:149 (-) Transcript_25564:197-643(-)